MISDCYPDKQTWVSIQKGKTESDALDDKIELISPRTLLSVVFDRLPYGNTYNQVIHPHSLLSVYCYGIVKVLVPCTTFIHTSNRTDIAHAPVSARGSTPLG